mmetsp:Transcript_26729/g.77077  ORF Transcript_26729/g.77077 Transcript_26729/m.77077 type:complete len:648 (-) Transcript_26729:1032-2975(-)
MIFIMHNKSGSKAEGGSLWVPYIAAFPPAFRAFQAGLVASILAVLFIGLSRSTLHMSILSATGGLLPSSKPREFTMTNRVANHRISTATSLQKTSTPDKISLSHALGKTANETCPTHYRNAFNDNEFSPIIFPQRNLLVCRTPKVGSQELRAVSTAWKADVPFAERADPRTFNQSILADVADPLLFHRYLYDEESHRRIMFVRHPVLRILSGFLQIANKMTFWRLHDMERPSRKNSAYASPRSFHKWVLNETLFRRYYRSKCDDADDMTLKDIDLHSKLQHYAPPQYCRCGIADCGVEWTYYRLEDGKSIRDVLQQDGAIPNKYLKPDKASEQIMHQRSYLYSKRDYLTDEVLAYLNAVTKREQTFFGYQPLTAPDLDENPSSAERNETRSDEAFLPENIKDTDKIKCGANKCFFELRAHDNIGYLATPSKRSYPSKQSEEAWFESLQAAWDLEKQLGEKYGILHFALEPPRSLTISKEFEGLNEKLWRDDKQEYARVLRSRNSKKYRLNFPSQSTAYIQKMKKAPSPNLLIGCANSKVQQFKKEVADFLPLIDDKKRFAREFKLNLDMAREIMKEEKCLIQDFQVLSDSEGRVFHFDFDRCFEPYDDNKATVKRNVSITKQTACFEALDEIESIFLERLKAHTPSG